MESDCDLLDAKAILEWQAELGISEAISEKPINRFKKNADEKPSGATFNPDATSVSIELQSPIDEAVLISANAKNLLELKTAIENFPHCDLKRCLLYTSPSPRD